jgi:hypothetical protein
MNETSKVRLLERSFGEKKRLVEKQDFIHVAILATVALVIGVYLIATTVLIAKDGTLYIESAQSIANNPAKAIHNTSSWGYPFLIYLMHKMTDLFDNSASLQGWIVSAQAVCLVSKIIASIALYFAGSYFVGPRLSFWGVLILNVLPDSAEYGSDALSNWPNIMFLATAFLLLLLGSRLHKNWIFGWTGITAGLGYLIRPECGQVVLYGSTWLLFNLIRPQEKMKRTKVIGALILLLAGFAVIVIPYIRCKGYIFPRQGIWKLPAISGTSNNNISSICNIDMYLAGLPTEKIIGSETLITNMCETLLYYFIPALLVGCYYYFRKQVKTLEQTFFAAAFIVGNIAIVLWQQLYRGPFSRRYTLLLVAFTIFYIPVGFHILASWLSGKIYRGTAAEENIRCCFLILMAAGLVICLPKLVRPIRIDKQGYRDTAEWLNKNTAPKDVIAVPDSRIAFYAEREGLHYYGKIAEQRNILKQVNYIVITVRDDEEKLWLDKNIKEEYSTWINSKRNSKMVICKVFH